MFEILRPFLPEHFWPLSDRKLLWRHTAKKESFPRGFFHTVNGKDWRGWRRAFKSFASTHSGYYRRRSNLKSYNFYELSYDGKVRWNTERVVWIRWKFFSTINRSNESCRRSEIYAPFSDPPYRPQYLRVCLSFSSPNAAFSEWVEDLWLILTSPCPQLRTSNTSPWVFTTYVLFSGT